MSTGIPHNPANTANPITNENARQQAASGPPLRMSLQLPENKRLKLQQHERRVMESSNQKLASGQQQQQQSQQQHSQQYYTNPTYQQASVSRPAFEQASSSYQVNQASVSGSRTNPNKSLNQGQIQGASYQYVQTQQHGAQQYQTGPSNSGPNPMMNQSHISHANQGSSYQYGQPSQASNQQYQPAPSNQSQNPMSASAGPSNQSANMNGNYQMYNLPPSARPSTSSGPSGGMGNPQTGSTGQITTQGQPMLLRIDDSSGESSGSGAQTRMENTGFGDYGMQGSNSSGAPGMHYKAMGVNPGNGSMQPPGQAMSAATDMPAFSGGSFAMNAPAMSTGGNTVSGYQVGPGVGTFEQSLGQIGQPPQSYMQEIGSKSQGSSGAGQAQGGSGTVDQESFEVCSIPWTVFEVNTHLLLLVYETKEMATTSDARTRRRRRVVFDTV